MLEKKGDTLLAHVLGDKDDQGEQRIAPYLWMSSLLTTNSSELTGGGGSSLTSPEELGEIPTLMATLSMSIPDVVVGDMELYAPKFIRFIAKVHDKYIDTINENDFLAIALDYFHDAESKFVFSNEGFISAMISMESLFNEGPGDIKYKLSHRAAFLLGIYGLDSIEAFEVLKRLYDNRSKLVHGGGKLKHDPDRHLVSKYTRRCLIMFLILLKNVDRQSSAAKKRKSEVLREIDYAMLNEKGRSSLEKKIAKGLKDFEMKIPRSFEGKKEGEFYRITAW